MKDFDWFTEIKARQEDDPAELIDNETEFGNIENKSMPLKLYSRQKSLADVW